MKIPGEKNDGEDDVVFEPFEDHIDINLIHQLPNPLLDILSSDLADSLVAMTVPAQLSVG